MRIKRYADGLLDDRQRMNPHIIVTPQRQVLHLSRCPGCGAFLRQPVGQGRPRTYCDAECKAEHQRQRIIDEVDQELRDGVTDATARD